MKKQFIIFLFFFAAFSGTAFAEIIEHVQIGDLYYNLDTKNNTAEVTYKADYLSDNYGDLTTASIPPFITHNGSTYKVTKIGDCAFWSSPNLASVTIPDGITYIGSSAFRWCSSLESITIPEGVTFIGILAFSDCASLASIIIPNSVIEIDGLAFANCKSLPVINNIRYADKFLVEAVDKSLSSYTIKKDTKWIGTDAFYGCSINSLVIPENVMWISNCAFESCEIKTLTLNCPHIVESDNRDGASFGQLTVSRVKIGNNIKRIGNGFFTERLYNKFGEYLEITLPNTITFIGDYAFSRTSINTIILPESVTHIGEGAFSGCSELNHISIPNKVDTIKKNTFLSTWLQSIDLQQGVKYIEDSAFLYSSHLETAVLPEGLISIGNNAFEECTSLTNTTIPNSVEYIGTDAFKGCPNSIENNLRYIGNYLVEVVDKTRESYNIKSGTKWIGNSAFKDCSNIYSITIPDGVVDIGESAFLNCSMLRQIKLPSTLKHIGAWAFDGTFYANKEANWEDHGLYIDKYLLSVSRYYSSSYYNFALFKIKEGTYLVADSAAESAFVYELDIPSSLKIIGAGAFANNYTDYYGIHELNLPSTLEYIGERAFAGNNIFSVEVPSSINYIGADAFKGVTNILYNGSLLDAPWGASFLNAYEESGILYESKARKEILTSHDFKGSRLVIPNSVTKIHKKAFNENSYIHSVILGANIEEIESKAFYCYYLDTIYSFLKEPIAIPNDAFGWIDYPNTLLYVSQDQLEDYYRADVWREFDIVPIIADVVSTEEDISISTTESEAIIVVELIDGATIYELTVSLLDSTLVATFTYNSSGELINTVFNAPSRFQKEAYQFIVSGLDSGTTYIYSMVAKDENGNTIKTKEGTFNTIALHGIENINVTDLENSRKISRDGQIFILRGEHTYTVTGQQVK